MSSISIKVSFKNETRRFGIQQKSSFKQVVATLSSIFNIVPNDFLFQYMDNENDWIVLSSEEEWSEALYNYRDKALLRIQIIRKQKKETFKQQMLKSFVEIPSPRREDVMSSPLLSHVKEGGPGLSKQQIPCPLQHSIEEEEEELMEQKLPFQTHDTLNTQINSLHIGEQCKMEPGALSSSSAPHSSSSAPLSSSLPSPVSSSAAPLSSNPPVLAAPSPPVLVEETRESIQYPFESQLQMLNSMGFVNEEQNKKLLTKFKGNVEQAVEELING